MVLNDAVVLGFTRNRHYFEGEVFAKGDSVTMSIEGYVLDLANPDSNSLSQYIKDQTKDKFEKSVGLSNYQLSANAANIFLNVYPQQLPNQSPSQQAVEDIIVNGQNYGKGRILSIDSQSSPGMHENKIYVGKYTISVEFFYSLGSAVFSVQGSGAGGNDYYHGLETILEPFAHNLETFAEAFEYTRSATGEETYVHNISIKVRDDGTPWGTIPGTVNYGSLDSRTRLASPENIGAYIAWWIYKNSKPEFPLTTMASFDLNDDTGIGNSPHDGFYSETYDKVGGSCSFSKTWKKQLSQDPGATGWSMETHRFVVDGIEYTASWTYTITMADGFFTVTEKGDILRVGAGLDPDGSGRRKRTPNTANVFKYVIEDGLGTGDGAYARCNTAAMIAGFGTAGFYGGGLETKFFEAPQEHRFGYETTYSTDPQILDLFGGFKVEKKLSVQRNPDGTNKFTNEATATPLRKSTIYGQVLNVGGQGEGNVLGGGAYNLKTDIVSTHTIKNILAIVLGDGTVADSHMRSGVTKQGSLPSAHFLQTDGWARYFSNAFGYNVGNYKIESSNTVVTPVPAFGSLGAAWAGAAITYKVSVTQVWTDDKTSMNLWNGTYNGYFTRKMISVDNTAPVKKKESYMIAGWGEVLHTSPQSEIGTININFQGTLKRKMGWNAIYRGSVLSQGEWGAAVTEAQLNCMTYFGSAATNPAHMFITDTQVSVTSDREFTMTVILSYTKASYTTSLEVRS